MKKFFRILIPIILALAVVFCMGWYLFNYDREFTRDMLLTGARYFDDRGNHGIAAWFYDRAYDHANDNDDVAIELAQQHKNSGNYTQAEATLSKAIEDGGGIKLYVALCQTYAEQDKLLDCVTLLNSVTNPEIKAELDAMRPAAPVATPEPGFYNQYISVTIEAENGTVYVNPNGEYPSIHTDSYTAPIPLIAGENTIYALSVNDQGLVSTLSIFGYTVGGVIEQVEFSDPAMERQMREMLQVNDSAVLYSNELWDITSFTVPENAKNYDDLKYLPFLEELSITKGPSASLQVISSLAKLRKVEIIDTTVNADELSVIGSLPKLEHLVLNNCNLSTSAGLERATGLRYLDLSNNTIRNISALASMVGLQEVYLQNNAVADLSSLSACKALTKLNASGNSLTTIAPIGGINGLTWLDISNNQLTTLEQIGGLTMLKELYLSKNRLTSIAGLDACTALQVLYLNDNQLTDISLVSKLTNITMLDFSNNQVAELPAFSTDCALVTIDGANNLLESLDALGGLEHLNNVYMDYNENIESVEALANCHVLIRVDVYGTKVTEVGMLTEQSIIVNYNPTQEEA